MAGGVVESQGQTRAVVAACVGEPDAARLVKRLLAPLTARLLAPLIARPVALYAARVVIGFFIGPPLR